MNTAQAPVPTVSLLGLPLELLQQILCHAVLNLNFPTLRIVHSRLNQEILSNSQHLLQVLLGQSAVSEHTASMIKSSLPSFSTCHSTELPEATIQLLCLHADLHTALTLTSVLLAQHDGSLGFPVSVNYTAIDPGGVQSLLVFSAFHRALGRMDSRVNEMPITPQEVLARGPMSETVVVSKLTTSFMDFLHDQLTLDDLESLISVAGLCANVVPKRANMEPSFSRGNAYHFQDRQIGKALLVEQVLWKGLSWLRTILEKYSTSTSTVQSTNETAIAGQAPDVGWHGSRGDATRITAHGLAKVLWRERSRKIAWAEKMGIERTRGARPWMELRFDAAVWRGSAGDM